MKKIISIVIAAVVVCSLSACANRNAAIGNGTTNKGITQGTRTEYGIDYRGTRTGYNTGNNGTTQGVNTTYRDGIYTGQGNTPGNTNQVATVTVSGGRITDITLRTLDNQGREVTQDTTSVGRTANNMKNGTGFTGITGNTNNNTAGNIGNAARNITSDLGNTAKNVGRDIGSGIRNMGNDVGITNGTNNGTVTGRNTGTTTGTNNAFSGYERTRRELASRMLTSQTYNVYIDDLDVLLASNWRLAVKNALSKAAAR